MPSNHYTIIIIHTRFSAPSKNCANNNHCNPGRGAPSRRALQRFSANLEHRHALLSEEGGSDS